MACGVAFLLFKSLYVKIAFIATFFKIFVSSYESFKIEC